MYVPGPITELIETLGAIDWHGKNGEEVVRQLLCDVCDRLHYSFLWGQRIVNMLGPSYVARVGIPNCSPEEIFLKFCPPPKDIAFSDRYKAIQEPLWQSGIFHIYGVTTNWVAMECVTWPTAEERESIPEYELIADLWLRMHSLDTSYFDDFPCVQKIDVAPTLRRYFDAFYRISRSEPKHIRDFFDELNENYESVFSAVLSPDPRDIVFCQGELYPRHTTFVRRGIGWECRVVDWDTPVIGPRWHDLSFYLRVGARLEDELLLPIYVDMLSDKMPRDFDTVMNIYFQYGFARLIMHIASHEMQKYFPEENIAKLRERLLR